MTGRSGSARLAPYAGLAAAVAAAVAAVEVATYPRWRPWCLHWGATTDEASAALPGDDLGPGRGGAYTYDWIENLLGLNMHSADKILPQYQDLKVGDGQQLGSLIMERKMLIGIKERAERLAATVGQPDTPQGPV